MKKVLFIDRDGTIILEPPTDFQVDSLEKLEFYPKVLQNLAKIVNELDYELVMVTNQDGLGTESFPQKDFDLPHQKMLDTLKNEGILFSEQLIDDSFEKDNSPNRKPRLGMLQKYIHGNYDLANSYVIGDRKTDVELAKNLGSKSIFIGVENFAEATLTTNSWNQIYQYLKEIPRRSKVIRNTNETKIEIELNLDGSGKSNINTGLAFFDHMLEQISKHGNFDLNVKVDGDLQVDEHHTIEDTAIVLGECFLLALGTKKGIERYAFLLPMDDCLAQIALDFGGRNWLVWDVEFKREKIGEMPTEMFYHFFKSFSDASKSNINIKCEGENEHHKIESIFKAFAKVLKAAVKKDENNFSIPSTKGSL
ncbi:bifunctional histidinol-phosphatase/imidazoleglycerol-phosphate dehydratase HisB [Halpernia frigidisoli]|uniref:Histidine biosynthesis bifunctional protein HisB n=1 Tax=Halpernia frigidisoli TaxID=1125876 RepID=A0A1I3CV18_9FLAO|nr:bifunctional histidinol-phosphatase/imidazoleglycerol-phosphate dehydratase HisB [Halpernia frigidisoli]SFH78273.1 imidazoleglycerol-phosphate dehydratase [Halpernia frigidisoli]